MTSAFAAPLIVRPDQTSIGLERVALSGGNSAEAYSEDWLQDLLYRHPQALPVTEIDDSFSGLVPVCREMETPVGPVDVVYVTRTGRPVIVEAKLWRNPESRRKVIGQILDYAKELSRWNYETFDAAVRRARRAEDGESPKGLVELMGLAKDSPEAARFFDALSQSLKRGDLLLLIVGDGIREGVGAIADFLEGHASLHFTFGLVEMAIFQMPDGGQLVQPRVLAQSTIVRRIVVDLRHESIEATEAMRRETTRNRRSPEVVAEPGAIPEFLERVPAKLKLDDKSAAGPGAGEVAEPVLQHAEGVGWLGERLCGAVGQSRRRVPDVHERADRRPAVCGAEGRQGRGRAGARDTGRVGERRQQALDREREELRRTDSSRITQRRSRPRWRIT